MDERALQIIRDYATANADKPLRGVDKALEDVAIVWKCKALQNWKYLLITARSRNDGTYYELTYNGDKKEWYLDVYKKFENKIIKED